MKLLRCGPLNKEKPAVLDKNGKIRDISSYINDLNPQNISFTNLEKLRNINLESLPEIPSSERIGSCIANPGKFVGIGLNYSDHAAETGAKIPTEPIVFMKATSCIVGPNDVGLAILGKFVQHFGVIAVNQDYLSFPIAKITDEGIIIHCLKLAF